MGYRANKEAAKYRSDKPTKTDQAASKETDINRIVGQFLTTGQAPGSGTPPRMGDFTQIPDNLRDMINASRSVTRLRKSLPEKLRDKPIEELLALTPDKLEEILKPPAPPPAPPGNEPK